MDEGRMTAAERKRIESLDKQIEKLQEKISIKHREYDSMMDELHQLLDERYPERKEENIKKQLYEAYLDSNRSLDEIMAFMEGRDDEIDW